MPEKILVVDDEQHIRDSSVQLLRRKGYEASGAESGTEALSRIQREAFDLLLLDVRMPDMDGIEVLRRATEMIPDIQVLILTGHGTIDTAIEALEYGAVGFLRKPVTIQDLQISVQDAIARGKTRKENTRLRALMPLFELNQQLLSELDEKRLTDLIINTVKAEIGPDKAEIMLWDEDGSNPVAGPEEGAFAEADSEIINKVSALMSPVILDKESRRIYDDWEDISAIQSGYEVYVPLVSRDKTTGILRVVKSPPHTPLQPSDLEFLVTLCGQSSIGLSNARLYHGLEKAHSEVEELLKRIISSIENERFRISLELHDGPIQMVAGSQFEVQACRLLLKEDIGQVDEKLSVIGKNLLDCNQTLRRIMSDLHPPDLEKSGLIPAIQEYLKLTESQNGLECQLKTKGTPAKLVYETERSLYYIVREAITNIVKHAGASTARVMIEFSEDCLSIAVSDNGKGFTPAEEEDANRLEHVGLRGMKERMRILHGDISIESKPGEGTTVELSLPLAEHIQN